MLVVQLPVVVVLRRLNDTVKCIRHKGVLVGQYAMASTI